MLDLSKKYGTYENIVFYGDHEDDALVYYLPDEISLAPKNGKNQAYELFFQYFEDELGAGNNATDLKGSFLEMGVCCSVAEKRLSKALDALKKDRNLPDNVAATTPIWIDGDVNFITFDADSSEDLSKNPNKSNFVESIKAAKKPSLGASNLKSVFTVKLGAAGTEIVRAAMTGGSGALATIIYSLQYQGLRPAASVRIKADLSKCQETASHSLEADVAYVSSDIEAKLSAELDWLTQKMIENKDIQIDVLSTMESAEDKAAFNQIVSDFKDKVLDELFTKELTPLASNFDDSKWQKIAGAAGEALGNAVSNSGNQAKPAGDNNNSQDADQDDAKKGLTPPKIGIAYKYKHEKIELGRTIEVDYRDRSVITRPHNPQAGLFLYGLGIKEHLDEYMQKVDLGSAWYKNQEVEVSLDYDFTSPSSDLLSAEVLLWRMDDGISSDAAEGCFSMPSNAAKIGSYTFKKDKLDPQIFSWKTEDYIKSRYYYQVKMRYDRNIKNISSPSEIVTAPISSNSLNLSIIPDHVSPVYYKKIKISADNTVNFDIFSSIDMLFTLYDAKLNFLDRQIVTLTKDNPTDWLIFRNNGNSELHIELVKVYNFVSGRGPIKTPSFFFIDDESRISSPLITKKINVFMSGNARNISSVYLNLEVLSPLSENEITSSFICHPGEKDIEVIPFEVFSNEDTVKWTTTAMYIMPDGSRERRKLQSGEVKASDEMEIDINLSRANTSTLTVNWRFHRLDLADITSLNVEIKDAEGNVIKTLKYSGETELKPVTIEYTTGSELYMNIEKRYISGELEVLKDIQIEEPEVTI